MELISECSSAGSKLPDQRPRDFTIQCADGSLEVHADVLASSSGYFKALFSGCLLETKLRGVHIRHVSLAEMTKVVDFMYGEREVEIDAESALDLICIAKYLEVDAMIPKCLEVIQANLSVDNAFQVHRLANHYSLRNLSEIAFDFLARNVVSLVRRDDFLVDVDANLMRTLLESDDLTVPDENFVLNLLIAWVNVNPDARMPYAAELKELIRFPFLRKGTVARFEGLFSTVRTVSNLRQVERGLGTRASCVDIVVELLRLPFLAVTRLVAHLKSALAETKWRAADWNLALPPFRRRQYTRAHCHLLWQELSPDAPQCGSKRVLLTCNCLGQSQKVLVQGRWMFMWPMYDVAASGHKMYSRTSYSVYTYKARGGPNCKSILKPRGIYGVRNAQTEYPFQLCATKDGLLRMISNPGSPLIQGYSTVAGRFKKLTPVQEDPLTPVTPRWPKQLVLDALNRRFIDPLTGRLEKDENLPDAVKGAQWYFATQRGDTVFLWYGSSKTERDFVTTLNLSTRQWGREVEVLHQKLAEGGTHPIVVQGRVYTVVESGIYDLWTQSRRFTINLLDETNGVFQRVQELLSDNVRFLGVVPLDIGTPCAMDTWLSAEIRELPDTTPNERAFIEQLRDIAG